VTQVRRAGAEVVDRQAQAHGHQLPQRVGDMLGVVHDHRLGQLQFQPVGWQAAGFERLQHGLPDMAASELHRRQLDRRREVAQALAAPGRHLAAGFVQHPGADLGDQAGAFGHRDEKRRLHLAQLRVAPAQQGLGADDAARAQVQLRLPVQAEFTARQRLLQAGQHLRVGQHTVVHCRVEKAQTPPAQCLGAVQRDVDVLQHGIELAAVVGTERLDHRAGDTRGSVGCSHVGQDEQELVATQSADGVGGTHQALQAAAHLLQQLVTRQMAERFADGAAQDFGHQPDTEPRAEQDAPDMHRRAGPRGQGQTRAGLASARSTARRSAPASPPAAGPRTATAGPA
jgi:hypothetical protein